MGDLPDWFTQIQSATLRATSIQGGLDADKSASPVAEDVYLARDTGILYVCFVSGSWTNIGILYLLLAGGTMSGTIVFAAGQTGTYLLLAGGTMSGAIAMGTNKITGMGDPTANQDAATKAYVDTLLGSASALQTAGRTTTSTIFVDLTEMTVTITTTGGKVLILFQGSCAWNDTAGQEVYFKLLRDSTYKGGCFGGDSRFVPVIAMLDSPAAGTYTYKIQWKVAGGEGSLAFTTTTDRSSLIALEVKA